MTCQGRSLKLTRATYLLVAGLALANGGCVAIAATAAGGAAVGYAYYKGKVCGTYNASLADTWAATQTALRELGMPVVKEERHGEKGFIDSRTADGEHMRIHLHALVSKIPAEGEITQVCVRVATFGDRPVSGRVLDQVGLHLAPAGVAATAAPPGVAASGVVQAGATTPAQTLPPPTAAAPLQTAPPPLLPPEPQPARK